MYPRRIDSETHTCVRGSPSREKKRRACVQNESVSVLLSLSLSLSLSKGNMHMYAEKSWRFVPVPKTLQKSYASEK